MMNLADRYSRWRSASERLCEEAPLQSPREISDLEVQARWFAGEFGSEFPTLDGGRVEIHDFGVWNRENGPTFSGASLSYGGSPPLTGGIEVGAGELSSDQSAPLLRVTPGGGIGGDRRAARSPDGIPRVELDITALEFDVVRPVGGGCHAPLASLEEGRTMELLEAAAQARLCRKAARLQRLADRFGPSEALYQALAETLGYRNNKFPFMLLAQRFPLSHLRKDPESIDTLLFAGSGFLPSSDTESLPGITRGYLRDVWAQWWPHRNEYERIILPLSLWTTQGARPVNHPQRRVAALAEMVRHWSIIETLAADPSSLRSFFTRLRHPHWDTHYTLQSSPSQRRMALVGATRVTEMLANVFYPLAIPKTPRLWERYRNLPGAEPNRKVLTAAERLFGGNPLPKRLLKLAIYQQGLLQLFEDFCQSSSGDCSLCPLAERLESWR